VEQIKLEFCTVALHDIVQVDWKCWAPGRAYQWGIAYQLNTGGTDATALAELTNACHTLFADLVADCMSDLASIQEITARVVVGDWLPTSRYEIADKPGNVSQQCLPSENSVVLSQYTNAPNAKYNGRIYFGGLPEEFADQNELTSAGNAAFSALALELIKTIVISSPVAATWAPVVISRYEDKVKRVPPVYFKWETSSIRQSIYGQRRRRSRKQGFSPAVT
jgi:hypothetical protein